MLALDLWGRMAEELPDPLVSPDHDVRSLDGFMLNVERVLASELLAIGTPEECWAAFMLWCRAWKQVPGGSLPNDERTLAGFSGAGRRWKQVREVALHGFVLCSDGRLYHRFLCKEVERAYAAHVKYAARREDDRKRLSGWRAKRAQTRDETLDEMRFTTRSVALRQGQGQGQQEVSKSSVPNGTAAGAAPIDPQKAVFDRGKQVLGKASGGQITKLLRSVDGDCERAIALLNLAAGKSDAGEYIAGFLRGNGAGPTDDVLAETTRLYRNLGIE